MDNSSDFLAPEFRSPKPSHRRPWLIAGAILVAIALAGALVDGLQTQRTRRDIRDEASSSGFTDGQASCSVDAIDGRFDLSEDPDVDTEDTRFMFTEMFSCLGIDPEQSDCYIEAIAEQTGGLDPDMVERLGTSVTPADTEMLFRAGLQCSGIDPSVPETDCMIEALHEEFPTVFEHEMTPSEQAFAQQAIVRCVGAGS